MPSSFLDVAAVLRLSVLYSIVAFRALPSSLLDRQSFMIASLTPCRNGKAGRPSVGSGELLPGRTIALCPFLGL
jgi:hypothetical protein